MKHFTNALVGIIVLFVTTFQTVQADFSVDLPSPTFENQSRFIVKISIDGIPLEQNSSLRIDTSGTHTISYLINRSPDWFGSASTVSEEDKDADFNSSIAKNKMFLELWRGTPFTEDALFLNSFDISGARTGSVTSALPRAGNYFLVVNMPNVLYIDPQKTCTEYEAPSETCLPEVTLQAGTMDAERTYFKTAAQNYSYEWNTVREYVSAMGGSVFSIQNTAGPYSNILFIPGVMGSQLFEKVGGTEKKRWELSLLSSVEDVQSLFLNASGKSSKNIYTKDSGVITSVPIPFVGFTVYQKFFEQLAGLRSAGKITAFTAFPYDWRLAPGEIVENGVAYANRRAHLLETLTALASSSPTGKVTIVGHSYGGLIAKELVRKLEKEKKLSLVDTVMLVDTPQLGTPEALSGVLHGDVGSLTGFGGLYLSKQNARSLTENMPSAYTLLPSTLYVRNVTDPVVSLADAPLLRATSGVKNLAVTTQAELTKFLTSAAHRQKPEAGDVESPNVLTAKLLTAATSVHDVLDTWVPPTSVRFVQISGWGLDTTAGIAYRENKGFDCRFLQGCEYKTYISHTRNLVSDGDGTVVTPSALGTNGKPSFYINLYSSNLERKENYTHTNITETLAFQNLFLSLLSTSTPDMLPQYVSKTAPLFGDSLHKIRIRVQGTSRAGLASNGGRSAGVPSTSVGSPVLVADATIQNSYYQTSGETIYLGAGTDEPISLTIRGEGNTPINIEATSTGSGGAPVAITFPNIPASASTTVTVNIGDGTSPTPTVEVRNDSGNGSTTVTTIDPALAQVFSRIAEFKTKVAGMTIATSSKLQVHAKLQNLENIIMNNNLWNPEDSELRPEAGTTTLQMRTRNKITEAISWTVANTSTTSLRIQGKKTPEKLAPIFEAAQMLYITETFTVLGELIARTRLF